MSKVSGCTGSLTAALIRAKPRFMAKMDSLSISKAVERSLHLQGRFAVERSRSWTSTGGEKSKNSSETIARM